MPEQELDAPQRQAGFEEMGRTHVAQHVRVDHLREVRGLPSIPADAMHHACRYRARPGVAGQEPGPRFILLPIVASQREECRREHARPIVLAFALPPPQDHAGAVDSRDLQLAQFRYPYPRRIERGEDGPMFQVAWGAQ
jgi:hypothetical protein